MLSRFQRSRRDHFHPELLPKPQHSHFPLFLPLLCFPLQLLCFLPPAQHSHWWLPLPLLQPWQLQLLLQLLPLLPLLPSTLSLQLLLLPLLPLLPPPPTWLPQL